MNPSARGRAIGIERPVGVKTVVRASAAQIPGFHYCPPTSADKKELFYA